MNWNLPANHKDVYLPANVYVPDEVEFKAKYLDVLSLYFVGLTVSFPVQMFFLKDFSVTDSVSWGDFWMQFPLLNWLCMASYTTTTVALTRRSSRMWAYLSAAFLLTGINNTFVAFTGWDYSAIQAFSGTALFTLPLAPTVVLPAYRKMIWTSQREDFPSAAPRFKKRWRVELLSEGQAAPATGITINISDSGALIHMLNQAVPQNQFDVRLSEAHQGLILDCKARRVREDLLPSGKDKQPLPVVGIEFLSLTEDQRQHLHENLAKTKHSA